MTDTEALWANPHPHTTEGKRLLESFIGRPDEASARAVYRLSESDWFLRALGEGVEP